MLQPFAAQPCSHKAELLPRTRASPKVAVSRSAMEEEASIKYEIKQSVCLFSIANNFPSSLELAIYKSWVSYLIPNHISYLHVGTPRHLQQL
jgi:hypothetical protein